MKIKNILSTFVALFSLCSCIPTSSKRKSTSYSPDDVTSVSIVQPSTETILTTDQTQSETTSLNIDDVFICEIYSGVIYYNDENPNYRVAFTVDTLILTKVLNSGSVRLSIDALTITIKNVISKSTTWDHKYAACYIYMSVVDCNNTRIITKKQIWPFLDIKIGESYSSTSSVTIPFGISANCCPYKLIIN